MNYSVLVAKLIRLRLIWELNNYINEKILSNFMFANWSD